MARGAVRTSYAGVVEPFRLHPRRRRSPQAQPRTRKPSRSCRVSTPTGLPSSWTSTASACSSSFDGVGRGLGRADGRQRRRHVLLDRVGEQGLAGEERVEQDALGDRAGHLGRHDRRLGADHGHLRDAVLLEDVHRLGDGLGRVGVHEVGQPAGLAAQHLADGLAGALGPVDGEAVLARASRR